MTYGCIAEKLGHSFSKVIHNRLFDYDYELREIKKEDLGDFMLEKNFKAINVTIPYKESVIPYLDEISEIAREIGAVNTIVNENGRLKGYNTDFSGMTQLLNKNKIAITGKKVLILGSGGTSKTARAVVKSLGCSSCHVVSRSENNGYISYETAEKQHSDANVIINTTPVGMYPKIGVSPINISKYPSLEAVVDAVYNPIRTKLVCDAEKMGIKAVGGLYMLVAQAAIASEKFIGKNVPVSEIDRVYGEILMLKRNVVLTGMPGSGKSTIGKRIAQELSFDFYDTDELIVKKYGKKIPEIFSEIGEKGFRELESEAVFEIASVQGAVIATGGGAILNERNVDLLRENGIVYFMDRDINSIVATSDRPLSSNRADLEKRYVERYPLYKQRCDRHVKISNNVEENSQTIIKDFFNENTCD